MTECFVAAVWESALIAATLPDSPTSTRGLRAHVYCVPSVAAFPSAAIGVPMSRASVRYTTGLGYFGLPQLFGVPGSLQSTRPAHCTASRRVSASGAGNAVRIRP